MCTEDERVLIEVRLASVLSVDLFSAKLFPGGCAPNVAGVRLVVANARAEAIDIEIGFVGNRLPPRRAFRILKKAWSKLHTAAAKKRRDERESRDKRRRRGRGRAQAAVGGAAAAGAAALGRAASKPAHLLADEVRGVKHAIGAVERAMSANLTSTLARNREPTEQRWAQAMREKRAKQMHRGLSLRPPSLPRTCGRDSVAAA